MGEAVGRFVCGVWRIGIHHRDLDCADICAMQRGLWLFAAKNVFAANCLPFASACFIESKMNGALTILKRERDEAAEKIRELRTRIRDLENAINVLQGQPPTVHPGRGVGDLKKTVLNKLNDFGIDGATPKELAEALTRAGRQTSDASVSSTLSRLKNDSLVANRAGKWFAANASPHDSHAESSEEDEWDDPDGGVPF
jgi:hypothetical protein